MSSEITNRILGRYLHKNASSRQMDQAKKEMLERTKREYVFPASGLSNADTMKPIDVEALRALKDEGKVEWYIGKGYKAVRSSKTAGDIPKTVERYVKEHKEQGMDEGKAWAIAWSRYCVAGTTLIPTERGLVSVSDIYANSQGQKVVHSDGVEARESELMVASKSGRSVSSHIIHTGKKAVMDVETKHGYKLTSTPDHQILVLNEKNYDTEWVDVQDSLGRYAILPTQGVWGTETVLPKFHYKVNAWNNVVPFKQPTEMSPELARMLGYLVSEGSVTDEGVEFSNTNPKVIQDFVRCSTAVFGQEPIVEWRDRSEDNWKDCGKVRLRTRWYSEFFTLIGLPPGVAQDKEVPHVILSAPKRFVREFLVGFVEGDGYTGDADHQNRIDLATSSDTLAKQLHLLLLNFGLPSTLEHTKRGYFNVRIHSKPMAERYVERIGTAFKKVAVSGKRSRMRGSEFETIPADSLLDLGSKVRTAFPGSNRVSLSRILRNWDALEASRGSDGLVDNIRSLIDSKYLFDKITDVKSSGQVDVFDLSVPSDTSFVANGFIAHNCKYKYPNSPRCKQKDYFQGRDSAIAERVAGRVMNSAEIELGPGEFAKVERTPEQKAHKAKMEKLRSELDLQDRELLLEFGENENGVEQLTLTLDGGSPATITRTPDFFVEALSEAEHWMVPEDYVPVPKCAARVASRYMFKNAAVCSPLKNVPQRGDSVAGVSLSNDGVTIHFDSGARLFSHLSYGIVRDSEASDYSKEKAVERVNFLFNTSQEMLRRDDMLEALPSAADTSKSGPLREWFLPILQKKKEELERELDMGSKDITSVKRVMEKLLGKTASVRNELKNFPHKGETVEQLEFSKDEFEWPRIEIHFSGGTSLSVAAFWPFDIQDEFDGDEEQAKNEVDKLEKQYNNFE